jgi:predicted dehydrogenase
MRLGLLSAARITPLAIIEPHAADPDLGIELAAVAARDLPRAREVADEWGVTRAVGSYDELIADPDIDAIYIATPAALHRHWTLAALAAGKHVLCEKPLAVSRSEAEEMVQAAGAANRIMMEAFHWRYHPYAAQIRSIIDSGRLGEVHHITARFELQEGVIPQSDIRWDLALGGGALMDLGCYCVQWVRFAAGADPSVVGASAVCPVPEIDASLTAELAWDSGVTGSLSTSMIADGEAIDLVVQGSTATMRAVNPLAPQRGAQITITDHDSGHSEHPAVAGAGTTTYLEQLRVFRDAVLSGEPPATSGTDSIVNMSIIEDCYLAAGLVVRPAHPALD